jgi:flagella basal body P-ring formation protein FlgA
LFVAAGAFVAWRAHASPGTVPGRDSTLDAEARRIVGARLAVDDRRVLLDWRSLPTTPRRAGLPLRATGPDRAGLWTLEAGAPGEVRWVARLRVGIESQGPVAARRLPRGTVLTAGDMTVARVVNWGPVYAVSLPALPGWITRRVIRTGEPLREPAAVAAPLIAAGESILLVLSSQGVRLTVTGIATHTARLGERVTVRLGPKRVVAGTAAGPGLVTANDTTSP